MAAAGPAPDRNASAGRRSHRADPHRRRAENRERYADDHRAGWVLGPHKVDRRRDTLAVDQPRGARSEHHGGRRRTFFGPDDSSRHQHLCELGRGARAPCRHGHDWQRSRDAAQRGHSGAARTADGADPEPTSARAGETVTLQVHRYRDTLETGFIAGRSRWANGGLVLWRRHRLPGGPHRQPDLSDYDVAHRNDGGHRHRPDSSSRSARYRHRQRKSARHDREHRDGGRFHRSAACCGCDGVDGDADWQWRDGAGLQAPGGAPPGVPGSTSPGGPSIVSLSPTTIEQGGSWVGMALTGEGTHWQSRPPAGCAGSNITVDHGENSLGSPTRLGTVIHVSWDAAPGPRAVTVTSGSEVVTLPNAVTVVRRERPTARIQLTSARAGDTVTLRFIGTGTRWKQDSSQTGPGGRTVVLFSGAGIGSRRTPPTVMCIRPSRRPPK